MLSYKSIFSVYVLLAFVSPHIYVSSALISLATPLLLLIILWNIPGLSRYKYYNGLMFTHILIFVWAYSTYPFHLFDQQYLPNPRDLVSPVLLLLNIVTIYVLVNQYSIIKPKIVSWIGMVPVVIGLLQFFKVYSIHELIIKLYPRTNVDVFLEYSKWNWRSTSIFSLESNVFALYCISFLIFLIHSNAVKPIRKTVFASFTLLALITSGSISGILSLVIYFLVLMVLSFSIKILLRILILLIAAVYFFNEQVLTIVARQKLSIDALIPSSLIYRMEHAWADGLNIFYDSSAIIGAGPAINMIKFSMENEYLDFLVRYGLVGLLLYTIAIMSLFSPSNSFSLKYKTSITASNGMQLMAIPFIIFALSGSVFRLDRVLELIAIFLASLAQERSKNKKG